LFSPCVSSFSHLQHRPLTTPQDVAVKAEGTFCLRYRAFNMFSACDATGAIPVLAECFGGPFRVYSTKDFPGLRASTDLTKQISMHGVRLNARESERKRPRKREADDDELSRPSASGG